jgi:hypothetical protein
MLYKKSFIIVHLLNPKYDILNSLKCHNIYLLSINCLNRFQKSKVKDVHHY